MATINVVNPGSGNDIKANLETAINSAASSGDIIVLPAGDFPFTGTITTSKSFTLKGSTLAVVVWNGYASDFNAESNALQWLVSPATILRRNSSMSDASLDSVPMITFNYNSRSSSNIVVSDIEFISKTPSLVGANSVSPEIPPSDGGSMAADYCLIFSKTIDFSVTRCKFSYFGNAAISVNHYDDTANGLIYKCEFTRNAKGVDGLGLGYGIVVYGENQSWSRLAAFGSANYLFIENCKFSMHRHSVAAGGCAAYVARYNYIQDNVVTYLRSCQAIDAHGRRGGSLGSSNYFGTRCVEVYSNKIINTLYYNLRKDGTYDTYNGVNDVAGLNIITTGPLKVGQKYSIVNYVSGDNFTSIGAPSHVNGTVFVATGTTPSVWSNGSTLGLTRDEDDLIERGIFLKESEHLSYNNIISGFRFGNGVQVETINVYGTGNTGYPQIYTMNYNSGTTSGPSYIWNNTFSVFNGNCLTFNNYTSSIFQSGRDYFLSAFSYTPYTYPHDRRDDLNGVITPGRRNFRSRIFHNK